ncbi:MAG: ABC transporter permease [Polyangiaceae bacterium]
MRSALVELVLARWRSFYREPGALFWSFGFPLVLAVALGVAFRSRGPDPVVAAVVEGPHAERLAHELESRDVVVRRLDHAAALASMRTGKVAIVVDEADDDAPIYTVDETRPESRLARAKVDALLQRARGRTDAFEPVEVEMKEPGSRYIDFLVPGLIGSGLMQGGLWGVGYVIVEMRTRKLMKRYLATPMKKRDFLLAFVLVRGMFLLVELPFLLAFATLVFGVPVRGSLPSLVLVTTLGSVSFAGLGLLIASRAENVQTAGGLVNLASLPMLLTSGTFFSSARFPESIQPIVKVLPLTALNDSIRAVMLDAAPLRAIAPQIAILAGWGVGCFVLALRLFRWR